MTLDLTSFLWGVVACIAGLCITTILVALLTRALTLNISRLDDGSLNFELRLSIPPEEQS